MKSILIVFLLSLSTVVADGNDTTSSKVINIKNFGAIGDGVAMETEAVQKTIDSCHEAGGGVVWVRKRSQPSNGVVSNAIPRRPTAQGFLIVARREK